MSKPRMTQATRKKPTSLQEPLISSSHFREVFFIIAVALAALVMADLLSIQHIGFHQFGGPIGALMAQAFMSFFGFTSYLLPIALVFIGYLILQAKQLWTESDYKNLSWRILGLFLAVVGLNSVLSLCWQTSLENADLGGYLGDFFSQHFVAVMGEAASLIILSVCFLVGVTLFTKLSWLQGLDWLGKNCLVFLRVTARFLLTTQQKLSEKLTTYLIARKAKKAANALALEIKSPVVSRKNKTKAVSTAMVNKGSPEEARQTREGPVNIVLQKVQKNRQKSLFPSVERSEGLPSLTLLDQTPPATNKVSASVLENTSREVEARLLDFGIDVQVVAVHPGPVVTRYEMQLAPGIKVSKISGLAKDLARSLSVTSVRIVDVIPGKTTVGLEVPNENRQIVRLAEIFSSQQYEQARSLLSLALGKDISGNPVVVDLAKMPHLLVAGTTGSGKSVGVNAMLLSLLFKAEPADVRLIMIDPKMLELSIYEGIPHLLTPVVTDMKEAANALRWCVAEMDRRYRLMANLGVRNLAGYNQKIKEAEKGGEPILDPLWKAQDEFDSERPPLMTLPYVVVVIDEFADMMMVVGKKVEELIARIAQKARAAGIHMILATQRPSVDVITGLIKANIPARIAFQVSSRIDSRTILDQQGAEQLLGNGDMLYLTPGSGVPIRIHGAFVSDQEVHNVVADWKKRGEPVFIEQVTQIAEGAENGEEEGSAEQDPLYDKAVQIVLETRKASISNIQRRLKIGYNRAARLIESMEAAGLVGAMESNGTREVLVPGSE